MKFISRVILLAIALLIVVSCESTIAPDDLDILFPGKISQEDSVSVQMDTGEVIHLDADTQLKFNSVPVDTRCPVDMMCFLPGFAEVELLINSSSKSAGVGSSIHYGDYKITIKELSPRPSLDDNADDYIYSISLLITINDENTIWCDDKSDANISTDALTVSGAEVENDSLYTVLNYNGGCYLHDIKLFAYVESLDFTVPKIKLKFSHDANNDDCEAYITYDITFSLMPIQDLLQEQGCNSAILQISPPQSDEVVQEIVYEFN